MNFKKLESTLEAVLFALAEPIELERLSQALEIDELTIEQTLDNLSAKYIENERGLRLLKLENKYQLCTDTQFADEIRKVLEVKKNAPLSQAAFEVLAIIAYNQPITKSFVEQVRGVDCSGVISTLCQKQLIEEKGRLELPGRPLVYGTTSNFLRCFSMSSLDELPKIPEKENSNEEQTEKIQASESTDLPQSVDETQNLE